MHIPPWSPFLVYLGTNHCVGDGEGCCYVFTWLTFVALPQVTDKPVLIYPNSGERYDGEKKEWVVGSLSKLKPIRIIEAIFFRT